MCNNTFKLIFIRNTITIYAIMTDEYFDIYTLKLYAVYILKND